MGTLLQDLRYAARQLRKSPGFTLTAVFTLALGIGGTTAAFSLINALLLRPLPVTQPERLVALQEIRSSGSETSQFSSDRYKEYRDESRIFSSGLAAEGLSDLSFSTGGEPEMLLGNFVSGNYFDVLGVTSARGRLFSPEEDRAPGAHPVVVISHDLWRRRFGADPSIIGRTAILNSQPLTVVGIAPEGFRGTAVPFSVDVWVPLAMYPQVSAGSNAQTHGDVNNGLNTWLTLFGRLENGVSREQAQAALTVTARQLPKESAGSAEVTGVRLHRLSGTPVSSRGAMLGFTALLLSTAVLVLFIGAVNIAGMLLARATVRRREMAIRLALGARRGRLVRQLLTESVLLFLLGGAGGVMLAVGISHVLSVLEPAIPFRIALDLSLDLRVLGFALLLSLLTGVLFGTAPGLRASRPDLVPALKNHATSRAKRPSSLRNLFVVGQLAASFLLLVVAGLFARALQSAVSINPGFDPDNVVVTSLDLAPHGYGEERGREFYRQLLERVRSLPGVESASLASGVPLGSNYNMTRVQVEASESAADAPSRISVDNYTVGSPYFATMRIPLVAGRSFAESDRDGAPPVAIINETMARRYWTDGEALGKQIRRGGERLEIVGIARDSKYRSLGEDPRPFLYLPYTQHYSPQMTLHIRTTGAGAMGATNAGVRSEIRALDRNLPVVSAMSLSERMGTSLLPQRVAAASIGVFGSLGLLLASIGLYGVLAYSVGQRTHEIGIRLALGAATKDVLWMVVKQGLALLLIGGGIGFVVAVAATHVLTGLLAGLSPTDPVTLLGVALLLTAATLLASYLPARHAARLDPMLTIRAE